LLVLKAHAIGVNAAYMPTMPIPVHLICAIAAYPFGVLADRFDRGLWVVRKWPSASTD
jgi:hypothetical protein